MDVTSSIPLPPRTLGVALIVGFVAFLAGAQLAPRTAGPVVIATPAPSTAPTRLPAPTDMPDSSRFATVFDPGMLTRSAGMTCGGGSNGASRAGTAYVVYSGTCAVAPDRQPAAILALEAAISKSIRDTAQSRDGGFSRPNDPAESTVMAWDYVSNGFEGSVYLVATGSGPSLHVALLLTEHLPA